MRYVFPYRKQWIKVLRVERDVPRHYRICSKHFKVSFDLLYLFSFQLIIISFKPSDFFPRHQMQKKLMLRPSAVPTVIFLKNFLSVVVR